MKHAVSRLLICKTGGTRLDSTAVYALPYAAITSKPRLCESDWNGSYSCWRVKVKVKVTLEQATKAQRGSRGIALLFL